MKAIDLSDNRVFSTVIKLAVPAMIAQLVNVLYSIVDRMFVGNIEGIGDIALAGVGVCAPITTLISSFAFLVGTGGAPIFAMALGEGDDNKAKKILSTAAAMLVVIAAIVTVAVCSALRPILMTFGASDNSYEYARQYLLVYALGAVFSITATGLNQFIIAEGYSGVGMATVVIGAVANIALDPLFIFTFGMGVTGAALATVISQTLSFAFVIVFLTRRSVKCRLALGKPSLKTAKKIAVMGISPFAIMATDSVIIIAVNVVLQRYGGEDGDMWITVSTIVQAFLSLITMPMLGISTGTQPVLSFNYGAKNPDLIRKAEIRIVGSCLVFTTVMFALSFVIAEPFTALFTSDPQITEKSVWGVRVYMIGIIPLALQYAFVDGFTALGQPKFAIVLSLTRKLMLYLVSAAALPAFFGVESAFYAEPIADIGAAALSTAMFAFAFPRILAKISPQKEAAQNTQTDETV